LALRSQRTGRQRPDPMVVVVEPPSQGQRLPPNGGRLPADTARGWRHPAGREGTASPVVRPPYHGDPAYCLRQSTGHLPLRQGVTVDSVVPSSTAVQQGGGASGEPLGCRRTPSQAGRGGAALLRPGSAVALLVPRYRGPEMWSLPLVDPDAAARRDIPARRMLRAAVCASLFVLPRFQRP
jgi:hypothetical protein